MLIRRSKSSLSNEIMLIPGKYIIFAYSLYCAPFALHVSRADWNTPCRSATCYVCLALEIEHLVRWNLLSVWACAEGVRPWTKFMVMEVNHNNDLTPIIGVQVSRKYITFRYKEMCFCANSIIKVTAIVWLQTSNGCCDFTRNPVDPAGGYRYWSSIKPCESRELDSRRTAQ